MATYVNPAPTSITPDAAPRSWISALLPAAAAAWVILALLALGTLASIAFFAWPSSDDYGRAGLLVGFLKIPASQEGVRPVRAESWLEYTRLMYFYWQGRWAIVGLNAWLLSRVPLPESYAWPLLGAAVLQSLSLGTAWRVLLGPIGLMRLGLLVLTTQVILWTGMPYPEESLYWFTGVFENQLPIWLAVIVFAGMIGLGRATRGVRRWTLPLLCILSFVTAGMHELAAVGLCFLLALGTLLAYREGSDARAAWLILLVITCAGAAVTMLAPGNTFRTAAVRQVAVRFGFPIPTDPVQRLRQTLSVVLAQQRHQLLNWPLDPKLLAATVLLVLSPGLRRASPGTSTSPSRTLCLTALFAWAALLALWCAAPAWVIGGWIPGRTIGGAFTIFLLGWIVNVVLWTSAPRAAAPPRPEAGIDFLRLLSLAILGAGILTQGNFRLAVQDWKHRRLQGFQAGRRAWEEQIHAARRRGQSELVVSDLESKPLLFGRVFLDTDPSIHTNDNMAKYFGLRSIRVDRLRDGGAPGDSPP